MCLFLFFSFLEKGNKLFRDCSHLQPWAALPPWITSGHLLGHLQGRGAGRLRDSCCLASPPVWWITEASGRRSGMAALTYSGLWSLDGGGQGQTSWKEGMAGPQSAGCWALFPWRANGTVSKKGRASWPGKGWGRARAAHAGSRGIPWRPDFGPPGTWGARLGQRAQPGSFWTRLLRDRGKSQRPAQLCSFFQSRCSAWGKRGSPPFWELDTCCL